MGEYAISGGKEIKIGTCEDMYYLRADQRYAVRALSGNVDPASTADLKTIRFRFPWPDEDGQAPGSFERYDRALGLYGIDVPTDVEHGNVQFVASAGFLVSLPCPESAAGKAFSDTFRIHRNGYPGPVQIVQTALRGGRWVLVARCGGCHYPYRYDTRQDVEPVIVAIRAEADQATRTDPGRSRWLHTVADRILEGCDVQRSERE